MDHIQVGGYRIAFEKAGEGAPVVLLHGGLSDHREWRSQIQGLEGEFVMIAWDAPGCGASSDPPETLGLDGYASCLAEFIDNLKLVKPHIVGLSFGAGLALELYKQRPDLPRSLTLVSAYAGWAGSLSPTEVEARLRQVMRQSELPAEDVVDSWLPDLLTTGASPEIVDELREIIGDFHPAGMRAMAHAFANADLRPTLAEIRVPTLLIHGEADRRSPLESAREMKETIPDSRLVVISGAGHQVNMEASHRFNEELSHFLEALL